MNDERWIEAINKAIDAYDNGTMTRAGLSIEVRAAVEAAANTAYDNGLEHGYNNADDDDDEIELDIDLDNIDEDEDTP